MRATHRTLTAAVASLTAAALGLLVTATPALADTTTDTYLVAAPDTATAEALVDSMSGTTQEVLDNVDMLSAHLTPAQAAALDSVPGVSVYPDVSVSVADVQNNPGWSLDRLDQTQPSLLSTANPNHQYWYPASAGAGVRIYILDTGVNAVSDLTGRLLPGYDATTATENGQSDCYGHGTSVATVAAGTANGAAKRATVVPVRVADCSGSATASNMIGGLNWIMANNPAGTPAVINISMAGQDFSSDSYNAIDLAVEAAVNAGFFVTLAAGNFSPSFTQAADACQVYPARAASAFTMGAIDPNVNSSAEGRASFSNAGSCLDAWAPGQWVNAMNSAGTAVQVAGTSFAAPLAAGVSAVYLGENPSATPTQVTTALKNAGQRDALINNGTDPLDANVRFSAPGVTYPASSTSPNLVLQSAVPVPDVTGKITDVTWTATRSSGTLTFTAPAGTTTQLTLTRGGETARTQTVTGSSATFTDLTVGASYLLTATTINDGLLSITPFTTTVTTSSSVSAPAAPTAVTADATGAISWTAPVDNGGSPITGYQVQTSLNGSVWTAATCPAGTTTHCTLAGLASQTSYQVRVAAVNGAGTSPFSAPASLTTGQLVPGTPTSVTVTNSTTSAATLSWTAPTDAGVSPITDYDIEFSYDGGTNWYHYSHTPSTATSINFMYGGARPGWTFQVKVSAVNAYGTGKPAATLTYTTPTGIPDAPTNVQTVSATWSTITVSWTAPAAGSNGSGPITDYNVMYSADNGASWSAWPHTASTATTATITGLKPSRTYLIAVSAATSYAVGGNATTTAATANGAPATPPSVKIVSTSTSGVSLSWTAPTTPSDAPILDYITKYSLDGGATWTSVAHTASATPAVTVTYPKTTVSTKAMWTVAAVNKYGTSKSASYSYTTPNGTPGAPQALTVVSNTVSGVKLSWSAGTNGASPTSYYLVSYSLDAGATWTALTRATATTLTYTYPTARSLTAMTWKVQAVNSYGTGAGSTVSYVTPSTVPRAITNLTVTTNTAAKTVLTWNAPNDPGASPISDYIIMRSSNGGSTWTTVADGISTATTFTATYPMKNTTYIYRVLAKNSYGWGPYEQVTFTTPAR